MLSSDGGTGQSLFPRRRQVQGDALSAQGHDFLPFLSSHVSSLQIFDLPSTNYEIDLTDDFYHMGVSVDVTALTSGKQPRRRFLHKVPTGQVGKKCLEKCFS